MNFDKLKPACEAIAILPTKANIEALQNLLVNISPRSMQQHQVYILVPLLTQVDKNEKWNTQDIKALLIATITTVLQRTRLEQSTPLRVLSVVVLKQIFDPAQFCMKPDLCEELKLSAIRCFEFMFQALGDDLMLDVYQRDNSGLMAQIIYVAVLMIEKEVFRTLRIAGIKCLMAAFYVHDKADVNDVVVRHQVANQLFIVLPKVVASLHKVMLGDAKQGQELITLSIKALGKVLALIFEDYDKKHLQSMDNSLSARDLVRLVEQTHANAEASPDIDRSADKVLGMSLKGLSNEQKMKHVSDLSRTDEWLEAAIRKVMPVLDSMTVLVGNPEQPVRLELAILASELIQKSSKDIQKHLSPLIQVLVALTQDDNPIVSKHCFDTLTNITTRLNASNHLDQLESIFLAQLTRLPRLIHAGSEDELMAAVLLFTGLLQSLSQTRLKSVLSCANTLDRFVAVLLSIFEIDRSGDMLHEQHFTGNVIRDPSLGTPWKRFVHLGNAKLVNYSCRLVRIVGRSNAVEIVFKCLMDLLMDNDLRCNEGLVVLQLLLALNGWGEVERIEQCLQELLAPRHWQLDVRADRTTRLEMEEFGESSWYQDRTEGLYESAISIRYTDLQVADEPIQSFAEETISIAEAKFNVQHICLILETIGRLGQDLRHGFDPFRMRTLHGVLEKTGSNNFLIHSAGAFALDCLSEAGGYVDVAELIYENADYIAYYVNLSLKKANLSKSALDILSVVLRYSSLSSVAYLESIINTVLDESAKPYQAVNISSFIQVFHMILDSFNRWTQNTTPQLDDVETSPTGNTSQTSESVVLQKWLDLLSPPNQPTEDNEDSCSDAQFPENYSQAEEETKPADLPKHVQIACVILKRSIKHMSTKSKMDKCLVLDTLILGLTVIGGYENELLPMVHALWPPFSERIRDQDAVILRKCFGVLVVLGDLAKDFLYQRTSKDIFPFLLTFLRQTSVASQQRYHDASFEHSQQFKLTMEILSQLPLLTRHLNITEKDHDQLLDAVRPFLHRHQHRQPLQLGAQDFMVQSADLHAAAVYVKLLDLRDNEAFSVNVKAIFEQLF